MSTGTPGSLSTSRSPTSVRKISGEAFTTRLEITLDLAFQLLRVYLERVDLGSAEGLEELPTSQPRDLRSGPLRDPAAGIPEEGRGKPQLPREFLGRAAQAGEGFFGDFDRHRAHVA